MKKILLIMLLSCAIGIKAAEAVLIEPTTRIEGQSNIEGLSKKEPSVVPKEDGSNENPLLNRRTLPICIGMLASGVILKHADNLDKEQTQNTIISQGAGLRLCSVLAAVTGRALLSYSVGKKGYSLGFPGDFVKHILSGYIAGAVLLEGFNLFAFCASESMNYGLL